MTTTPGPRTEAGQRLYQRLRDMPLGSDPAYTSEDWPEAADAILAIEAEARADVDGLERWLNAIHEDANGLIWTTKEELRSLLAGDKAEAPPTARDVT